MNFKEWLDTLTEWPRGYFLPWFVGLWVLASYSIAWESGWRRLAKFYKASQAFDGLVFMSAYGYLGGVPHRKVLFLGPTPQGLHLSMFPLLRLAHPPLFIAWSDVQVRFTQRSRERVVVLEFRHVPAALLEISETLATSIAEASGSAFRLPESAEPSAS